MKASGLGIWLGLNLVASSAAWAQDYPTRAIHVLVPMQVGSAGDLAVRLVARRVATNVGQALAVENIAGAAGRIGAERLAHALADGYIIGGMGDSILTLLPHMQRGLDYDPVRDFEPISLVATIVSVLVVHPSVPVGTIRDLIGVAKASPKSLDYASAGTGSQQHVAMELFRDATRTQFNHIPFRGASQAAMEVVSGRVPMMFGALSIVLPFIKDGRLKVLAVASHKRSGLLPSVPTMIEAGVGDFAFAPWVALYAPAGTPRSVIDRLNKEIAAALREPDLQEQLKSHGLEPEASTPAELRQRTKDDFARMGRLIRASGIKSE